MRAYRFTGGSGIPGLTIVDEPEPVAGPGQVVVAVQATSLNYRDLMMLGRRGGAAVVPLSDGAGEVVAVGEGVTRVAVGDRVAGCFFPGWESGPFEARYHRAALGGTAPGMLAERVVLPEGGVVRLPAQLSYAEAATLPCAAVTAWNAMFCEAAVQPGHTVLVLGTGGVSIVGLQLAKAAGARCLVTSSSDEKLARAAELGADGLINYRRQEDWQKAVLELTDGRGVDLILEVGGAGTLPRSFEAAATGGMISLIGILSGTRGEVNPGPMVGKALRMVGIYVGSRRMFEDLNAAITTSSIRPVIDATFPFEQAADAYRLLESQAHFGKVVIEL